MTKKKASTKSKDGEEVEPWINSEAKHILREMIVAGTVNKTSNPHDVFKLNELFALYDFSNFKTNLSNLIEAVAKDYTRLQLDMEAFGHDVALKDILRAENPPPKPKYPSWHEHEARHLLRDDIAKGLHKIHDPIDLWMTREEHQEFPLDVFRNHIYQEEDKEMKQAARFDKKKLRSMKIRDFVRDTVLTAEEATLVDQGGALPAHQSNLSYPATTAKKNKKEEALKTSAPIITTVAKKRGRRHKGTNISTQSTSSQSQDRQQTNKKNSAADRKQKALERLQKSSNK